ESAQASRTCEYQETLATARQARTELRRARRRAGRCRRAGGRRRSWLPAGGRPRSWVLGQQAQARATRRRLSSRQIIVLMIQNIKGGMAWVAVAATFWLAPVPSAQETPEAIQPDRPDVTNGTRIVPTGIVQLEVGGLYSRTGPGATAGNFELHDPCRDDSSA